MSLYTRDRYKFIGNLLKYPTYPRILIEGDSWTDHPFVANIAWVLNLYLGPKVHILNISCIGDLIANIGDKNKEQYATLKDVLGNHMYEFDLMFLSGGGNDLLANNKEEYTLHYLLKSATSNNPEDYIDEAVLTAIFASIKASYDNILSLAHQVNPGMPVLSHNYDYIYPRNEGVDIIIDNIKGPWIYPTMIKKGIQDQALQKSITDYLLNRFSPILDELKQQHPHFDYVSTQGTLPAQSAPWTNKVPFWDDEIHPNSKGFNKLVEERIGPKVKELLGR